MRAILIGFIEPPVGALALRGSPPVEADNCERQYLKHSWMFLWVPNLLTLDHSSSIASFLLVDAVELEIFGVCVDIFMCKFAIAYFSVAR